MYWSKEIQKNTKKCKICKIVQYVHVMHFYKNALNPLFWAFGGWAQILMDTLGYRFFWILGKFLGSKYPSIQKKTCFYAKLPDTWDS